MGENTLRYKTKIKARIKEIREELKLTQQELASKIGVSRQTIYFLEKGKYNPSLTISFKIAEVLKKPIAEIFFQEPIVKDEIKKVKIKRSYQEIEDFANKHNIGLDTLFRMGDIDENFLSVNFTRPFLENLAEFLGYKFDDLFIDTEF
ncbi:MAG: helix-turn-helix transcriptional regulator [Promethearchaeota archaeon]